MSIDQSAPAATEQDGTAAATGANATQRFAADKQLAADTPPERVSLLVGEVLSAVHDTISRHEVTYDEYNALKAWLIQVGEDGEWPLFLDVWVEHAVEEVGAGDDADVEDTLDDEPEPDADAGVAATTAPSGEAD